MGRGSPLRAGRRMRPALALGAVLAAFAVTAPASQANFTTTPCGGNNVTGDGASFQNTAHNSVWKPLFNAQCGGSPTITYLPNGSGEGVRRMGVRTGDNADGSKSRNQGIRFGATDDAPSTTDVSQMNQGTDAAGDEGTIHTIPVAVGAVAALVNFPDNCDRSLLPDSAETNPASANSAPFIDRVRFTRAQYEDIWVGDSAHDEWTEIFPTLASDPDCNAFITRVVRFDSSGTTNAFKTYLNHLDATTGWTGAPYIVGSENRTWPNATVAARADCAGSPQGPTGTHLTSGCANGNGSLVDKLNATDGSIGYSDVATARSKGDDITPGGSRDDDKFWTQVQSSAGGNPFVEPTEDPNGFRTDGQKGANCEQTVFTGVPASTLSNWSSTDGTDSAIGYGICTLTYELAWDDYKGPYSLEGGGDATEELLARTVKDYLNVMVSDQGQENLYPNDYAQLPSNILAIARVGVNAVCWDKPGSGACPVTQYFYPRPKAATPLYIPLVNAYNTCGSPNRVHASPLVYGSCNPASQTSGFATSGTPDANGPAANLIGSVKYVATNGPGANDSDVAATVSVTDVRNVGSLTDYTGQLQVVNSVQLTDRQNGRSFGQAGTTQTFTFPFTVSCTTTGSTTVGSTCSATTSFNAILPGSIPEGKRAVWELGQVRVDDGGPDGVASTTAGNTPFLKQGVFIP
jgi:ABC-type phosphate transport system substrate-binding protein